MYRRIVVLVLLAACRESTTTQLDASVDGSVAVDAPRGDAPGPDGPPSRVMEVCATSCAALEACMPFPTCVSECVDDVSQLGCTAQELDAIEACALADCTTMFDCITAVPCLMH